MGHSHEGHRERLRTRLQREGLDSFQPHEVIELLLFYCIPLGDVNPLAHDLIDRFGSVGGVLSASRQELMSVRGVGNATADWFAALKPMLDMYLACTFTDRPRLISPGQVVDYAYILLSEAPLRQVWIAGMTLEGHLLGCIPIADEAKPGKKNIDAIKAFLMRCHADAALLLQRRSPDDMAFDMSDTAMARQVETALSPHRIRMLDYLLLSNEQHVSMWKSGMIQTSPKQVEGAAKDRAAERYIPR